MFIYLSPTMRTFRIEGSKSLLFAVEVWDADRLEWRPSELGLIDAKTVVKLSDMFQPVTPRTTRKSLKPNAVHYAETV